MKTPLWACIGPWQIERNKRDQTIMMSPSLSSRNNLTTETTSCIACYIYQSYLLYIIITLVPRVGSLILYIVLYVHDVLGMGQISSGCPHSQNLRAALPAFRLQSAGIRIHLIAICRHRQDRQRQEGWERWCRSEQRRWWFGKQGADLSYLWQVLRFLQYSAGQLSLEREEEETWVYSISAMILCT